MTRTTPFRNCLAAVGLLLACTAAPLGHAMDVDLDVDGKPEEACLNTEKTMRMLMNIWANNATETYASAKPELEQELAKHGERGTKILDVFHTIIPRMEANEFLPPNVISRYEGHQKLRAATHEACMKALKV